MPRKRFGIFAYGHEARGVFTVSQGLWGAMCTIRERGRPDFNAREVALLRRIAPHLGAGLKAAVLRSQASPKDNGDGTPGVLVLDRRGKGLRAFGRIKLRRRPRPPSR
jgi:hypothetical protein